MRSNSLLLRGVWPFCLFSQLVLQRCHRDVHCHGGMDQTIALCLRQAKLEHNQMGQHGTNQGVGCTVANRRVARKLEQQVQAQIRVALEQIAHPAVVLPDPLLKLLNAVRTVQNDAQT